MNRKLLAGGGIVAVLLGSALIVPGMIDWNKYKGRIVGQLEAATGHDYEIQGPLSMAILPYPHVSVDSLTVKAPAEQGGGTLLTLDKAAISVELLPLIHGNVNIRSITLDKPVITVSIGPDGTPSWMTPVLKAKQDASRDADTRKTDSSGASMSDRIALQSVRIRDGSIRFKDMRSGSETAGDSINLDIRADSLSGPFAAEGDFVYGKEKIDFEGKSGRIGGEGDGIPVQVTAKLPSSKTAIDFSGVAGVKAPLEIQGETHFSTASVAAALAPFVKALPQGLDKPADAKGILTYKPDAVAFRNAEISYAGLALSGGLGMNRPEGAPMAVDIDLSSDKPVDLDALLPPSQGASGAKGAGGEGGGKAAVTGFLPQTLTLPGDMTGKAVIGLKSVTFHGQSYANAVLSADLAPRGAKGTLKAGLPGNGALDAAFDLAYAAQSKGAGGSVALSDPNLGYRIRMHTTDPRKVLESFVKKETLDQASAILSSDMALDVKGTVTPSAIRADAGSFSLFDSQFAFSGSYTPAAAAGRDSAVLTVSADTLDADAWIKSMSSDKGQDAAVREDSADDRKAAVTETVRKISLPIDLDLGASIGKLRYNQNDYANVAVKGKLAGDRLTLDRAGFQDASGNELNVSGSVGSLKALGGVDISVSGKTPDADLLLKTMKVNPAGMPENVGPAEAVAEFKGQADHLGFTANVKALRGSLEASGALSDLLATPAVSDLTFRLRHPNYVDLVRLYNPSFRSSVDIQKNLDLFATVKKDGKVYRIGDIRATVGPSTMTGDVTADMGASVPSVQAALQFNTLPLDKLLGAEATTSGGQGTAAGAGSSRPDDARWSRDAIKTEWMRKWNADIKTTAGNVSYGTWQFTNAALDFVLKDGTLTLGKLDGGLYGGHVAMSGRMESSAQPRDPLDVSAKIALDGVSIESFVQSFSGSRLVKARGAISLDTQLEATGISPAALIFDLGGKGTVKGSAIEFQGFDLARLSRTLAQPSSSWKDNFSNLLGSAVSGGSTKFDTLDGAFTVSEGVINFDKMTLTGPSAVVDTTGKINLPLWTVDLLSSIALPEPKDNPPPPLKVAFKGPLDNPGQTFGQGALESYFMQQYGNKLQNRLIDKIDKKLDKNGVLGGVGKTILPGLLGGGAAAAPEQQPPTQQDAASPQPQTQTQEAPQTVEPSAPAPAPAQADQAAPQQAQPQQDEPQKPEDAFRGLLQGVIDQQLNRR